MKAGNPTSEALRLIRVYNDLSQKDLAEKLNISNSYLSEIEQGKKEPSISIINKYSKFFKISPSVILFFSENIQKNKGKTFFSLQTLFLKTLNFFEQFSENQK